MSGTEMVGDECADCPNLATCKGNENGQEGLEEAGITRIQCECRTIDGTMAPIDPEAGVRPGSHHVCSACSGRRDDVHARLKNSSREDSGSYERDSPRYTSRIQTLGSGHRDAFCNTKRTALEGRTFTHFNVEYTFTCESRVLRERILVVDTQATKRPDCEVCNGVSLTLKLVAPRSAKIRKTRFSLVTYETCIPRLLDRPVLYCLFDTYLVVKCLPVEVKVDWSGTWDL
jgi:hypothetical protein